MKDVVDFYYKLYLPALSFLSTSSDATALEILHNVIARASAIRLDEENIDNPDSANYFFQGYSLPTVECMFPAILNCKTATNAYPGVRFNLLNHERPRVNRVYNPMYAEVLDATLSDAAVSISKDTATRDHENKCLLLLEKMCSTLPKAQYEELMVLLKNTSSNPSANVPAIRSLLRNHQQLVAELRVLSSGKV